MTKKQKKAEIQRVPSELRELLVNALSGGRAEAVISVLGDGLALHATMGRASGPEVKFVIRVADISHSAEPQRQIDACVNLTLAQVEHLIERLKEQVEWLRQAERLGTEPSFTVEA